MTQQAKTGTATLKSADLTAEARSFAADVAQSAKDKAVGLVEQQKAAAAEQVEGVARLVEDVAGEVEQGVPVVAPYLREAASSIHRVSSTLRERSTDDLLQDLSEFARGRPAALVGVSLAAGFAVARFLKSSADRPAASRSQGSSSRTHGQRPSGSDQPFEAELSDTPSPVGPMASLSDVPAATRKSGDASSVATGTSAAGGGAEAPEPGRVGSI